MGGGCSEFPRRDAGTLFFFNFIGRGGHRTPPPRDPFSVALPTGQPGGGHRGLEAAGNYEVQTAEQVFSQWIFFFLEGG